MSRGDEPDPQPQEEWRFLLHDTDDTCSVCGEPIHAGQAAGYVGGGSVHAKCYDRARRPR